MTASELTSVVMVSYHTGPALDRAIVSVLAQTVPVEVILVNNGNSPEIEKKLADMATKDPRLHVITGQGDIGLWQAYNKGAQAAKGESLLFLGADCLLPPDAIAKLLSSSAPFTRPFMMGARIVDEKGKERPDCRRGLLTPVTAVVEVFRLGSYFPAFRLNLQRGASKAITMVPSISGSFMFMAAEDFHILKGFDEKYFLQMGDMDFCLRFGNANGKIYFAPDVVVKKVEKKSTPSILFEKQKARALTHYFHANFSHIYPQPALWLLDLGIWARFAARATYFSLPQPLKDKIKALPH